MATLVAALTYRRPAQLAGLLDGLAALTQPDGDVGFLVVDNDAAGSAAPVIDSARARFGDRLQYCVEPEPGIPAARNRALAEAAARGAPLLCFIDDDVRPDPGWLRALLACRERSRAAIVFGAVRFERAAPAAGWWRRRIAAGIAARGRVLERYAARHAARGLVVTGATSNCVIDVDWAARHGVRFDPAMRESGGSDTAFREAVRAHGGDVAWCADAVVYEQLPLERLSLRYQLRRAISHGMTTARTGRRAPGLILRHPAGRIAAGIALMALPLLGRGSFMVGLHLFGMGIGIIRGARGERSRLYAR